MLVREAQVSRSFFTLPHTTRIWERFQGMEEGLQIWSCNKITKDLIFVQATIVHAVHKVLIGIYLDLVGRCF